MNPETSGPGPEEMELEPKDVGSEETEAETEAIPEKEKEKPIDALIVYGAGIKTPHYLEKEKSEWERTAHRALPAGEGAEFKPVFGEQQRIERGKGWMLGIAPKLRVQAAAELYLRGQVRDVFLTGGAVRAKEGIQETEAGLMEKYFLHILGKRKRAELDQQIRERGKDPQDFADKIESEVRDYLQDTQEHIYKEDKATNTIENFSRTINSFDAQPDRYQNIAFLSNRFHISRIGLLAEMFQLPGKKISAEDTVSYAAQERGRHSNLYQNFLEKATDPNSNEEYRKMLLAENRWTGGLREIPTYFLPQTVYVSGERLKTMLGTLVNGEKNFADALRQAGIKTGEIDLMDEEELKGKISGIQRKAPPEEWGTARPPWYYQKEGEK